jgi:hypothetical protein
MEEGPLTDAQYGSSAAMALSSDSLNIPRLKTSLESEAPIVSCPWHLMGSPCGFRGGDGALVCLLLAQSRV